MSDEQLLLIATAAGIGVVHTLVGPDHYLPFITLSRARRWSLARTLGVTLVSGVGHVMGSVLLGILGLGLGWALGGLERLESMRGEVAGWLLLGFGIAYLVWGIRQAFRNRPHAHSHAHADGTVHEHVHVHRRSHAHLHEESPGAPGAQPWLFGGATVWTLFLVFVVGPCEPLIPLLMYPAAAGSAAGVVAVVTVFAAATLLTMTVLVAVGSAGLGRLPEGRWERWSHAVAGGIVAACGLAIQFGL